MIPLGMLSSRRPAAAGGAWAPADLGATLLAHYDASVTASITSADGLVSQWADLSPSGYHVTQTQQDIKPLTGARTLNGLNVIDFKRISAKSDILKRVGLTIPSPTTAALVWKLDATEATGSVPLSYGPSRYYAVAFPDRWEIRGQSTVGGGGTPITSTAVQTTSIMDGASSRLRLNGAQILAGNAGSTTGDSINLSAYSPVATNTGYGIDGCIAEIVIAAGVLTASDLTNLESYLKTKWGTP